MPKASIYQASFSSGQLSPLVQGRTDSERYKAGLDTVLNYLPTIQGPIVRRPGTRYVGPVKDSTNPPALIPFQFSQTQAYVLEFGQQYIRFYTNGGLVTTPTDLYRGNGLGNTTQGVVSYFAVRPTFTQLSGENAFSTYTTLTSGSPLELQSPYAAADVNDIRFAQNADTIYLTHPKYPVYKLQRFGLYSWRLVRVVFGDGPYLAQNTYSTVADSPYTTLTPSATAGGTISTGPTYTISNATNNGAGLIRITTSTANTYVSGMSVVVSGVGGTTEANNPTTGNIAWSINVINSTTFDLVGSAFVHAFTTSTGSVSPALFTQDSSGVFIDKYRLIRFIQTGGVAVSAILLQINSTSQAAFVTLNGVLTNTNVIPLWRLGEWYNGTNAYNNPASVTFHQSRLFFAGAPNQPQELNASQPGDYENFSPTRGDLTVTDANALQFTLSSSDVNAIKWIKSSTQGLLAGTQSSEWTIQPSTQNGVLTPTNFNASQSSYFGSANSDATLAGNSVLHIQRAQRKLRELNYFYQVGTFRSSDLTELADQLTLPSITKIVTQKETQPVVWAMRSDGNILGMIYNRDDLTLKAGWSLHKLGGQSDSGGTNPVVKSLAVIPSQDTTFDQLWLVVQRYINGQTVVFVEYLTKIYDDSILQDDAFQVDCGATFDSPFTISSVTQGATTLITTSSTHGLSVGDKVRFSNLVGLNVSTTDINGNTTTTNLLNNKTFLVGTVPTTTTFTITDYSGVNVNSAAYSAYVPQPSLVAQTGSGAVRKMITSISGLSWLKGETVGILADGGIHPAVTVSQTGTITLQYPAAKVQVGYLYNSDGKTLKPEIGSADGTSVGKTRRPNRAAFVMHKMGDFSTGPKFNDLVPLKFTQSDYQTYDNATPLYSGTLRVPTGNPSDFSGQICFRQASALPGTLQGISLMLDEQDV